MNKAKTLKNTKLKLSKIPKLEIYKVKQFFKNPDLIISEIKRIFENKKIAIRSSHIEEDGSKVSNAGKYLTFLNIDSKNKKEIKKK